MCIVFSREVWVVRYNSSVIVDKSVLDKGTTVVASSVDRVAILVHNGRFREGSGIAFGAFAILHTLSTGFDSSARPMHHTLRDDAVEVRLLVAIRNFSADDGINVLDGLRLVLGMQDDQDVGMRQATLLELYNVHSSHNSTQNMLVKQVLAKSVEFEFEDPRDDLGAFLSGLARQDSSGDFSPLGVGCEGDE